MEHLPYPKTPAFPCPPVPYVCTKPYDCGDFLTYPDAERGNYPQANTPMFLDYDDYECPSLEYFQDFIQRWLFFGLLHAVLQDDYREDDFVETRGSDRYVCTTRLPEKLRAWDLRVDTLDPGEKRMHSAYLLKCLWMVEACGKVFCGKHRPAFDRRIRMSIAALGETISELVARQFQIKTYPVGWWVLYTNYRRDPTFQASMVQSGWCLHDASTALQQSWKVGKIHYLVALPAPTLGRSHTGYTVNACRYRQIDMATYGPVHEPNCKCELLGPTLDELANTLGAGSFPILKVHGDTIEDVKIETIPFSLETPFVSFSHVWADGLGNPREHRLPRCQLLRLKNSIKGLENVQIRNSEEMEAAPCFLWCDTLCVPPHDLAAGDAYKKLRDAAMGRMRQVYESATYVLILDKTLEEYNFQSMHVLEAAFRLALSPWMRRLWTYQEVYLAATPLLKFADSMVDLQGLRNAILHLGLTDLTYHVPAKELDICTFEPLRIRSLRDSYTPANFLGALAKHLKTRRVSVVTDEAICLSVLLDLDTRKISETPDADKMQVLWSMIWSRPLSVPQSTIFDGTERIEKSPFRWAPRSIMNCGYIFGSDPDRCGTASSKGLIVEFPAWTARLAARGRFVKRWYLRWMQRIGPCFSMLLDEQGIWWSVQRINADRGDFYPARMTICSISSTRLSLSRLRKKSS